ncbi:MAG TPA: aminotransferase class I/II-fold pyridoxal phosphate-dependent enzyme, partial [Polyangia bacterium]|nr:aminotransferase class I/II-fold pyridoxal phosphate-dependent enzyme [Polyangia bacterium]
MPGYTPGEQIADLTKLNTNEGAFPPSPRVRAALAAVADETLRLYPDPTSSGLRAVAAARFGVAAEEVLAGNGSDDCLTILYRGFLDAGERVACPWPTYGLYSTLAALQGAELVRLPFAVEGRRFALPRDLARQGAKLIILANPNNPTATLIPVDALRALCDEARDAVVVVDEAYVDFALGAGLEASVLPHLRRHPNLVVLRTMSKSYSLAGARLGLLFAAAPIVEALTKVKDSYNVNALTQAIGVAALEDRAYFEDGVRRTLAERARLEAALAGMGLGWPESAANFLLVEIGPRAEAVSQALKQKGLLV